VAKDYGLGIGDFGMRIGFRVSGVGIGEKARDELRQPLKAVTIVLPIRLN